MTSGGVKRRSVSLARRRLAKSYFREVERSHRRYTAALKRAGSRQDVMNLYWRHKRQHEVLLRKHLRQVMHEVNKVKKNFK